MEKQNEMLFESEILKLDKDNYEKILNRKVKIQTRWKDNKSGSSEHFGIIKKINLASNFPHKPFDLILENREDNSNSTFGIIGITKIEFL